MKDAVEDNDASNYNSNVIIFDEVFDLILHVLDLIFESNINLVGSIKGIFWILWVQRRLLLLHLTGFFAVLPF